MVHTTKQDFVYFLLSKSNQLTPTLMDNEGLTLSFCPWVVKMVHLETATHFSIDQEDWPHNCPTFYADDTMSSSVAINSLMGTVDLALNPM